MPGAGSTGSLTPTGDRPATLYIDGTTGASRCEHPAARVLPCAAPVQLLRELRPPPSLLRALPQLRLRAPPKRRPLKTRTTVPLQALWSLPLLQRPKDRKPETPLDDAYLLSLLEERKGRRLPPHQRRSVNRTELPRQRPPYPLEPLLPELHNELAQLRVRLSQRLLGLPEPLRVHRLLPRQAVRSELEEPPPRLRDSCVVSDRYPPLQQLRRPKLYPLQDRRPRLPLLLHQVVLRPQLWLWLSALRHEKPLKQLKEPVQPQDPESCPVEKPLRVLQLRSPLLPRV